MKFSVDIRYDTPQEWVDAVLGNFDAFLQDHADCERKASSMAMSFVAKCPEKTKMLPELIDTALEELEHFKMVYEIMEKRGVQLQREIPKDVYMQQLMKVCRSGAEERLLDRMLLASVVECRGAERFRLIAENVQDEELAKLYKLFWTSEAKHGNIYVQLALEYWNKEEIYLRLNELTDAEAEICAVQPIRPTLH